MSDYREALETAIKIHKAGREKCLGCEMLTNHRTGKCAKCRAKKCT